jgi:hypothetical protein
MKHDPFVQVEIPPHQPTADPTEKAESEDSSPHGNDNQVLADSFELNIYY